MIEGQKMDQFIVYRSDYAGGINRGINIEQTNEK